MAHKNIFLYVPNLIGYGRLALLAAAFYYMEVRPYWFLGFYCSSILLDGIDGYAARKLNQVSTFGAWLDVVIDNLSRAMIWFYVSKFGWLVSSIEWTVFVCTHTLGKQWKTAATSSPPVWVQTVMANGFKTPIGTFVILGLHCLPIWFYVQKARLVGRLFTPVMQTVVTITLCSGRLLCLSVECWFIFNHIRDMATMDLPTQFKQDGNSSSEDEDDEEGDDETDGSEIHDEEAKASDEMERRPTKHKSVGRIGRRGPGIRPTPGSTMIDMGCTSEGKEQKVQEPQISVKKRGSTPEGAPRRRRPQERESPRRTKRPPNSNREEGLVDLNDDTLVTKQPNSQERRPSPGRARKPPNVDGNSPSATQQIHLPERRESHMDRRRAKSPPHEDSKREPADQNDGSSSPNLQIRIPGPLGRRRPRRWQVVNGEGGSAEGNAASPEQITQQKSTVSPLGERLPKTLANDIGEANSALQNYNEITSPSDQQAHSQERKRSLFSEKRPQNVNTRPVDENDNHGGTISPSGSIQQLHPQERKRGIFGKRKPKERQYAGDGKIESTGGNNNHDVITPSPQNEPSTKGRRNIFGKKKPTSVSQNDAAVGTGVSPIPDQNNKLINQRG